MRCAVFFSAAAACGVMMAFSGLAEARCVKHTGAASERSLAASSAQALDAWVTDARRRGPEFGVWARARHMEVHCRKVIAGSGPRRGPRWICEATGSSSDVAGGEDCPR